jgi:hypothetical protein
MVHKNVLEIGGITFTINTDPSFTLTGDDHPYPLFFSTTPPISNPTTVAVSVLLESPPDTHGLEKIFQGGNSWSMFRDDREYYITLHPPEEKEPFWTARFDQDLNWIIVYCGDVMVQRNGDKTVVANPVRYPLDQILLMYVLATRGGLLLHAAGACFGDRGIVFPGKSGAGKSTIAKILDGKEKISLLSDDRIVIGKRDGGFKAFGTPWPGDANVAVNKRTPLSELLFLKQGHVNRIVALPPENAFERLMPVTSIPWYDSVFMTRTLRICEEIVTTVPVYELEFRPDIEVVDVLEKFVLEK